MIPNPLTKAEAREKRELDAVYQDLRRKQRRAKGEERAKLDKAIKEQREKLRPYNRTKSHTHGWVWLYLRQADEKPDRR